uniref:TPD52 like 2 n=1 Tax=Macaca nemestrina TaxID=9545 RepID=A0A2K6DHE0_MACNE
VDHGDINLNSPNKGLLSDSMTDVPVDTGVAARTPAIEGLTEAEEEELRAELTKVLWLGCQSSCFDLLKCLGLLVLSVFSYVKTSEKLGEWNEKVTQSDLYKKTQETLSQAGQKTSAALSTVGSAISRKLGDMSLRLWVIERTALTTSLPQRGVVTSPCRIPHLSKPVVASPAAEHTQHALTLFSGAANQAD